MEKDVPNIIAGISKEDYKEASCSISPSPSEGTFLQFKSIAQQISNYCRQTGDAN